MTRGRTIEDSRRDYETLKRRIGKEEMAARTKRWRLANPEKTKDILARSRRRDPARKLLNNARTRAKAKGWEFDLEKEDILIPEICPLLEVKLDVWGPRDFCPSIDRINNTKGYVKGNIQVISFKANRMKNTASLEELKTFARNILKHDFDAGLGDEHSQQGQSV